MTKIMRRVICAIIGHRTVYACTAPVHICLRCGDPMYYHPDRT
jgi:hypothetical protein